MMSISCKGCSLEARFDDAKHGNFVGAIGQATGFEPLLRNDISMAWLCRDCLAKIVPHIKALIEILKDEDAKLYWNGLRSLPKNFDKSNAAEVQT